MRLIKAVALLADKTLNASLRVIRPSSKLCEVATKLTSRLGVLFKSRRLAHFEKSRAVAAPNRCGSYWRNTRTIRESYFTITDNTSLTDALY